MIDGLLLHSKDGGLTWKSTSYSIENLGFLSTFTILRDDTFLIAFMSRGRKEVHIGRSTDFGRTWSTKQLVLDLSPYTLAFAYNSQLLETADGALLLTLDLRAGPDAVKDKAVKELPLVLKGSFPHVFRSEDGGKTWPKRA